MAKSNAKVVTKKPVPQKGTKPAPKKRTDPVADDTLELVYPNRHYVMFGDFEGADQPPFTADNAKLLLGWEGETKPDKDGKGGVSFGGDAMSTDMFGLKFRCTHNISNRPFDRRRSMQYAQDVLCRRWKFNLEPMIIGKHGNVVSAQHRLTGLVFAYQLWSDDSPQHLYWQELWPKDKYPDGPTIECTVAFGCDEDAETVRTIDNVMPRTLADVLFTMGCMADIARSDRKEVCRMVDYAIRLLWHRTKMDDDAYRPNMSHSEAIDFIERHPTVLNAVKDIHVQNKEGGITKFFKAPGTAAGLLYLMGCSGVTGDRNAKNQLIKYADGMDGHVSTEMTFKKGGWERYDQACNYWSMLITSHTKVMEVRTALANLVNSDTGEPDLRKDTSAARSAIIIKGWNAFIEKGKVTAEDVELKWGYKHDRPVLNSWPELGGIDAGEPGGEEPLDDEPSSDTPDENEIEERKERVAREKMNGTKKALDAHREKQEASVAAQKRVWDELKLDNPGVVLLFKIRGKDGVDKLRAYWSDADTVAEPTAAEVQQVMGASAVTYLYSDKDEVVRQLLGAGIRVALVEETDDGPKATRINAASDPSEPAAEQEDDSESKPSRGAPRPRGNKRDYATQAQAEQAARQEEYARLDAEKREAAKKEAESQPRPKPKKRPTPINK